MDKTLFVPLDNTEISERMIRFQLLKRDEKFEVSKHIEMKTHQLIKEFVNSPLVLGTSWI